MTTITVSAYVEPIHSYIVNDNNSESIMTLSHIQKITSSLKTSKKRVVSTTAMIDNLSSSANTEIVSVVDDDTKSYKVTASVCDITASSQRIAKAFRTVGSHIHPIASYLTVELPQEVEKPIYATVYYVVNPTTVSNKENRTEMRYV